MADFYARAHHRLAKAVLRLFRVRVEGAENLPRTGGYLYCSNHICWIDPILVCAAAHTQVHYMAKKELFAVPGLSKLIRMLGAFPVDRGASDISAIRRSISLLEEKESIGVFIQGHRYRGVPLRETRPKNGAAMIASRAGADVVPICLKMKHNRFAPFRRIRLIVGKPIPCAALGLGDHSTGEYARAAGEIFAQICQLGDTE